MKCEMALREMKYAEYDTSGESHFILLTFKSCFGLTLQLQMRVLFLLHNTELSSLKRFAQTFPQCIVIKNKILSHSHGS